MLKSLSTKGILIRSNEDGSLYISMNKNVRKRLHRELKDAGYTLMDFRHYGMLKIIYESLNKLAKTNKGELDIDPNKY